MRKFLEKSFILLLCLYNSYKTELTRDLVLCFLISLIISLALDLFHNRRIKIFIYFFYIIVYFSNSLFLFYLPLILYNMYLDFGIYIFLTTPLNLMNFSVINLITCIVSIYFSIKSKEFDTILNKNKITRDELKEDTLYLKKYNEQLKIDREKNIHIAILTERNRIARELHDSIGHALSSSILQVEALKIISNENNVIENLSLLQKTLDNGMNDIRKSIHNLYNESLDLENKIQDLCNDIPKINVEINYKLGNDLSYDLKFDILSVVKEGITNCVKHSNATNLKISLLSQPKFYSITINDNGSNFNKNKSLLNKGIGLISMKDIANKYNGFLNFEYDNGFKIHLVLMKG